MRIEPDQNGNVSPDVKMIERQAAMQRVEDAKLAACLFCNGRALLTWKIHGYAIECENRFTTCPMNARTHRSDDVEMVIERWNTRPGLMSYVASFVATINHETSNRFCDTCGHGTPHKLKPDPETGSRCEVTTCGCQQLRLSV